MTVLRSLEQAARFLAVGAFLPLWRSACRAAAPANRWCSRSPISACSRPRYGRAVLRPDDPRESSDEGQAEDRFELTCPPAASQTPAAQASTSRPKTGRGSTQQIAKYPQGRQASAVISALWQAQKQNDYWLPQAAIEKVADMLGMPYIRVLEVATFYTMFNLEPVGKYFIQMCGTTPCMLCGSDGSSRLCEKRIGSSARSRPTACSPGSRSSASAPAAMRRWCRSTTTTTKI